MKSVREFALVVLSPIAFFLFVILVWQLVAQIGQIPKYVLPSPIAVGRAAWTGRSALCSALALTGAGALSGFAASLVVGTLIAFALRATLGI